MKNENKPKFIKKLEDNMYIIYLLIGVSIFVLAFINLLES